MKTEWIQSLAEAYALHSVCKTEGGQSKAWEYVLWYQSAPGTGICCAPLRKQNVFNLLTWEYVHNSHGEDYRGPSVPDMEICRDQCRPLV